jgi:hypothetical protein
MVEGMMEPPKEFRDLGRLNCSFALDEFVI